MSLRIGICFKVVNEKDCIDVAILAEGYTEKEMDIFYQDAQRTCESLFSYEPFRSMKGKFNIVAVASPSTDSGVSVPRKNHVETNGGSLPFRYFLLGPLSDYQPGKVYP